MSATTDFENDGICVLRISGVLKQAEFAAQQAAIAKKIDEGVKPRLLAIAEDFQGWERGTDWNDLDFMFKYGGEIARIAIVAEPEWEPKALAFAGAGVRRARVRFFYPDAEQQAREWLLE
jgi:stage II sporulation SpoAA-like protein